MRRQKAETTAALVYITESSSGEYWGGLEGELHIEECMQALHSLILFIQ